MGDILIVGVVTDSGCRAYKGEFPIQNVQQRAEHIQQLGFVDVVEIQITTDPSPLLERFRPDVFTHGDDWDKLLVGQDTIDRLGIKWTLLPYTRDVSSTELKAAKPLCPCGDLDCAGVH